MVKICEFNEAHRVKLRDIYQSSRRQAFHWINPSLFQLTDFDKDTKDEKILVAIDDSAPAGFISIWLPDNFIHHLFVHPDFMKRRIGKMLLDAAVEILDQLATLKCLKLNQHALDFYIHQGWVIEAEVDDENGGYYLMKFK